MIDGGGPMLKISVGGKVFEFEMHWYCGPTLLNAKGEPIDLNKHPKAFLEAVSLWAKQGKRMENGLCRWDHEPEEIREHLGGRHWKIVGYHPAKRGE